MRVHKGGIIQFKVTLSGSKCASLCARLNRVRSYKLRGHTNTSQCAGVCQTQVVVTSNVADKDFANKTVLS